MKKIITGILLSILFLFSFTLFSLAAGEDDFKVIGYYSGDLFDNPINDLQVEKMTHIMYAFLKPNIDGTCIALEKPEQLRAVVEKAHDADTKVFIALGGWSHNGVPLVTTFEAIAASDELRAKLVKEVIEVVREYDLDGVELDWEHPSASSAASYEKLVLDLREALLKEGKGLTAALNGAWSTTAGPETSNYISDACLSAFDFISIMCYDMNNADHSPFWFTNTSIDYWLNRGVTSEKIVVGMPLYARPSWKQYRHMVQEDVNNAYRDYYASIPLESHYNGLPTLCRKTVLAYEKAGGVMLFDVNEDTSDEYSVISMIDTTLTQLKENASLGGKIAEWAQTEELQKIVEPMRDIDLYVKKKDMVSRQWIYTTISPQIENDRTLLPIRVVANVLSVPIEWNGETRQVIVTGSDKKIVFQIGKREAEIYNLKGAWQQTILMDVEAKMIDQRTMIPLRFTAENLDVSVDWNHAERSVTLKF